MSIEEFLRSIQPFESGSLQEFLQELHKVPNLEAKFAELIRRDPVWLASALSTKADESDDYHIYYLLDYQKSCTFDNAPLEENQLFLRHFRMGDNKPAPTIKVLSKRRDYSNPYPHQK